METVLRKRASPTNHAYMRLALERSPVFAGVNRDDLRQLASMATLRKVEKDEFILMQGDEPRSYNVIAQGEARVFRHSRDGKEFIMSMLYPGDTIGDSALFRKEPSWVSIQAITETIMVAFEREEFLDFVIRNPIVLFRISEVVAARLSKATNTIMGLLVDEAEIRIVKVLVALCSHYGDTIPFSHQQVADMAGITRETTSKVLEKLAHDRLIYPLRRYIAILDRDELRLRCGCATSKTGI